MTLTAGMILQVSAELKLRPSILLDVLHRVIQQGAGADAERLRDLE